MARGPKGPRYLALELASTHLTTRAARGAEWASGPTERSARVRGIGPPGVKMERETGFEPATSTLARSHSTTELFPLAEPLKYHDRLDQGYGGVRLKPDATGRPTQLPSASMTSAASYERWRAALSRCLSVV